jgi:hypothetical protein
MMALVLTAVAGLGAQAPATKPRAGLAELVQQLARDTVWTPAGSIPVKFRTHHPQGMVKVGDVFYVSSVEVTVRTKRFPELRDGYDRDPGDGVGHLFKIDARGNLIASVTLGEGAIYHPGGIDYDGVSLWVPVAEYRPNSRSIVYRIDPASLKATAVLRFADHIGAVARNTDDDTLHGVSWGSRRFYRWPIGGDGRVTNALEPPARLGRPNPSHYVDYQDCKYAGGHRMLCTGVAELRPTPSAAPFRLGGLDLVDLRDGRPIHQVPVPLWTPSGLDLTHNPVWLEPLAAADDRGAGLRGYFMPEDDESTIYIYEARRR